MTAYCPTCRRDFPIEATPPYSVIHCGDGQHLDAITRAALTGPTP